MNGKFSVGEKILILPLAIEARIVSMRTEKQELSFARPGGLIAIQTDINPTFCSLLVGCTFIKVKDYVPDRLLKGGALLKFKYTLLNDCGIDKLKKDDKVVINYSGGNIDAVVAKSSKEKYRGTLCLTKPMYIFPGESVTFTMVLSEQSGSSRTSANKRLIGFGRSLEGLSSSVRSEENGDRFEMEYPDYDQLLETFASRLKEWKETSMAQVKIPVPKTLYRNTFTTIVNFGGIADSLNVSTDELGSYVYHELGCKSWSVNGQRQLILKGRTDERKVISVLHHFIMEKRCMLCRQNSVKTVRNMGVKQRVCTKCSWKA